MQYAEETPSLLEGFFLYTVIHVTTRDGEQDTKYLRTKWKTITRQATIIACRVIVFSTYYQYNFIIVNDKLKIMIEVLRHGGNMKIGYKIKELRLGRSMTQEQLAEQMSVSTQCISKWENHVTTPDIQMLPLLSTFFGVTIDELFDLSDDAYLGRIEAMLENRKILDTEEFLRAESFLLQKERENPDNAKYPMLLADIYNHMAEGYEHLTEVKAMRAIELEPDNKYNHSLLRMAQKGSQMDWNFENRAKRIEYYKKFVDANPLIERGYICLIDELIAAHRLDEAERVILQMEKNVTTLRPMFYKGYLLWVKNEKEQAKKQWSDMLAEHGKEWLGYALLGDCMANYCEYKKAIQYYEKSLELQEKPRYTDSQIAIAMIYEIVGDKKEAIKSWEKVLNILMTEHNITEGQYIDQIQREIVKLQKNSMYIL